MGAFVLIGRAQKEVWGGQGCGVDRVWARGFGPSSASERHVLQKAACFEGSEDRSMS